MARNYSSVAALTTLTSGVTALDGTLQVLSTSGYPPSTPFTLVVDPGKMEEEIVEVTAVAGLTLTVIRGVDGTAATAHSAGAEVRHMATARDFREPQQHIDSTVAHGAQGTVVGTQNAQSLSNKTLVNPTLSGTMSGGTVNPNTLQQAGVPAVTTSGAQALTNKDLSSPTNTFPPSLATDAEVDAKVAGHSAAKSGVHGVSGDVVGTSGAQTLSGKTLASPTLSGTMSGGTVSAALRQNGKRFVWKEFTGKTAADGTLTVTHGAGFTPDVVVITSSQPGSSFTVPWGVDNVTSTQFRVRFFMIRFADPFIVQASGETVRFYAFIGE